MKILNKSFISGVLVTALMLTGFVIYSATSVKPSLACGWYWEKTPAAVVSGPYFDQYQQKNTYIDFAVWIERNSCNNYRILENRVTVEDGTSVNMTFRISAFRSGSQINPCSPDVCAGLGSGSFAYMNTPQFSGGTSIVSGNNTLSGLHTTTSGNIVSTGPTVTTSE